MIDEPVLACGHGPLCVTQRGAAGRNDHGMQGPAHVVVGNK